MSLLYLQEEEPTIAVTDECYKDLALEELILAIASRKEEQQIIRNIFQKVPVNEETVCYRQQILKDFLTNEQLCTGMEHALEKLKILKNYSDFCVVGGMSKASVWELLDYLQELEIYVQVIKEFNQVFKETPVQAPALTDIAKRIDSIVASGGLEHIMEDIKELRADVSTTKSICLGVNLSPDLYPEEVKIIRFNKVSYRIDSPFGLGEMTGGSNNYATDAILKCMTSEIEKHLSRCVRRMKHVFKQYVDLDGYFLVDLYEDFTYYLLMAKFWREMKQKGYAVCLPQIVHNSKDIRIDSVYNIRLALQGDKNIVKNDFNFSKKERIYILTGPNRGGKTILTQGVGLAAYMASVGLFVAADRYEGYLVKQILTHFPVEENTTINYGRLGEEAIRIQQIAKCADEQTLVLLNETYSTTCSSDGLYLAKDLVHVLKHNNVAAIYNTHIHELARATEEMNAWDGDSDIVSIVMEMAENENTFRVVRSQPNTTSYARNIAMKYGVTYEQMMKGR